MDYIIHEGDFPIDATHTLIDPMANITHLTPGNLLVVGFHLAGGDAGDTYHVILYDPNGDVFQSFSHTFSSSARHTWWYWLFEPSEEDRGTWSVDIELNGTVQMSHDFANGSLESSHVYQAEAADLLQGGAIESNHNGFNGLGFANMSPSNGRLRWSNIDAGSGGAVLVALRYALKASASRTAELIVNGATQTITFEPTGQWNRWNHVYQQVNLRDTLSNRIELHTTGQDSGNIDELVIAMQAEDAFVNGRGKIERNHAGFRGTGFVNLQPAGGVVEWVDVDGRGGGAANLTFRYALGASAARTAQLHINGDTQPIRFEPTGSWSTWSTIRVRTWLGSGPANTVLMETQGEDAGNIDQLFVTN
jgi:hypothetical protein